MKYCPDCGTQLADQAAFCTNCGHKLDAAPNRSINIAPPNDESLQIIVKIFLILGCIVLGWMILPLAWCLPITLTILGKLKRAEPISVGLKVASLLLVSPIAGIVLLLRDN